MKATTPEDSDTVAVPTEADPSLLSEVVVLPSATVNVHSGQKTGLCRGQVRKPRPSVAVNVK